MSPTEAPLPQIGAAPVAPPMFGIAAGKKPKGKSMQPSFLGSGTTPQPGELGNKTLLGM